MFRWKWLRSSSLNKALGLVEVAGVVGSAFHPLWGFLVVLAQIGPVGLSVRGVTSPLAWTSRLRRLAIAAGGIFIVLVAAGLTMDQAVTIVGPLFLLPVTIDVVLWILVPVEKRLGAQWVEKASAKLRSVGADVVAITGSYGKTTTKSYVAHLLGGSRRTVASPASFNNRMGLARAINENLVPGTEVFVAEMGTYGRGEIAELCEWIPPKVAALVAIGPVHLERFKTLENIVDAKSEILDRAEVGVICIDHPLLADLARERASTMRIIEVSTGGGIVVEGRRVADGRAGVFPANLAVALGICQALGIEVDEVLPRVRDLPTAEHRQSVMKAGSGFTIIDNTFNSNPAGARSALASLAEAGVGGKTAVITPGMVELGPVQSKENIEFAEAASAQVDHFVIVGRTNRPYLLAGSAKGKASVTVVESRDEAVEWAREHLGPGDAVLYENDLPDHYP